MCRPERHQSNIETINNGQIPYPTVQNLQIFVRIWLSTNQLTKIGQKIGQDRFDIEDFLDSGLIHRINNLQTQASKTYVSVCNVGRSCRSKLNVPGGDREHPGPRFPAGLPTSYA